MNISKQRDAVLQAVNSSYDHPTAEMVLYRSKNIIPTINLATVYRNLACLVENGQINKVRCEGGDRYDRNTSRHAHFKCKNCNSLMDVDLDISSIEENVKEKYNLIVDDSSLFFNGICDNCLLK